MTDLELIFSMLGEKATTEITKAKESKGYGKCLTSSMEGHENPHAFCSDFQAFQTLAPRI